MADLNGRIVLVAGASTGTGRAIALAAAEAGADVAIAARNEAGLKSVAAEIDAMGRRSLPLQGDLSKVEDCRRVVDGVAGHFGRIDSLIYNAAYEHPRAILKIEEDDWDRMLDTNLKGFFFTAQAVARWMNDGEVAGNIVAIASTAGTVGFPINADYSASKGGMIALVKAMAIDFGRYGIRVNALAPGFIEGDALIAAENAGGGKVLDALRNFLPSRRFAAQSEVASAAIFLASDAASYFNGSIVMADGGLTLGNLPPI